MLLEGLDDERDDLLGCWRVYILANAHHDHLYESAEYELHVLDLLDTLIGVFHGRLELLEDLH